MKTLLALLLVIALGAAAYWYFTEGQHQPEVVRTQDQVQKRAEQMKQSVQEHLKDFHLSTPEIKQELERTGRVVRQKAQEVGHAIANATVDARTTAAIKAKLLKDPNLSALDISVNTTAGVVTLSGSVDSPERIAEAMKLALDTDGVDQVISTLQVKASK